MSNLLVGGVDEVGRGALAGPILAACALFRVAQGPACGDSPIHGLADSKTFSSAERRERVFRELLWSPHLVDVGVGECSVAEINERGIDWCNATAFQRAIMALKQVPDFLYVDGTKGVYGWPRERQHIEPKADSKYWPVSAASIVAKVVRDRLMDELGMTHSGYAWSSNKGYGSDLHQKTLIKHGPTEHHRTLFVRKILSK